MRIHRLREAFKSRIAALVSTSATPSSFTEKARAPEVGREATAASSNACGAMSTPMYVQRARLRISARNNSRIGLALLLLSFLPSLQSNALALSALIVCMAVCVVRGIWILTASQALEH